MESLGVAEFVAKDEEKNGGIGIPVADKGLESALFSFFSLSPCGDWDQCLSWAWCPLLPYISNYSFGQEQRWE